MTRNTFLNAKIKVATTITGIVIVETHVSVQNRYSVIVANDGAEVH